MHSGAIFESERELIRNESTNRGCMIWIPNFVVTLILRVISRFALRKVKARTQEVGTRQSVVIGLVLTITRLQGQEIAIEIQDMVWHTLILKKAKSKRCDLSATVAGSITRIVAGSITRNPSEVTASVNVQVKELRWVSYVQQHIIVPEMW